MTEGGGVAVDLPPIPEPLAKPHYKIQMAFGPHWIAKHADFLAEPLSQCDIYIPEFGLWNEAGLQMWNDVARGTVTPEDMIQKISDPAFRQHHKRVLELLYKSGKHVGLIDIPRGHALEAERMDLDIRNSNVTVDLPSFDEVLAAKEDQIRLEANWIRRREDYMIEQLPQVLERITSDNSQMGQKDSVNVLLSLGSTHTRVLHKLKELGYDVAKPLLPGPQVVFDYYHEAERSAIFNKPIDRLVIARGVIDRLVYRQAKNKYGGNFRFLTEDPLKIPLLMRRLFDSFTYEDCEKLWQQRNSTFGVFHPFLDILKTKGLSFPKNERGLDAMLATSSKSTAEWDKAKSSE